MNISNTLFNDTENGIIAWANQLKDSSISWSKVDYDKIPAEFKTELNKFQSKLNDFFLKHYNEWQTFLTDKGVEGVIDTWRDVEEFLENISDDEAVRIQRMFTHLQDEIDEIAGGDGGAFNISTYNAVEGVPARYNSFIEALDAVPISKRNGGLNIQYIDNLKDKYVQYRLNSKTWTTDEAYWDIIEDQKEVLFFDGFYHPDTLVEGGNASGVFLDIERGAFVGFSRSRGGVMTYYSTWTGVGTSGEFVHIHGKVSDSKYYNDTSGKARLDKYYINTNDNLMYFLKKFYDDESEEYEYSYETIPELENASSAAEMWND